jgi:hypothetical protein
LMMNMNLLAKLVYMNYYERTKNGSITCIYFKMLIFRKA